MNERLANFFQKVKKDASYERKMRLADIGANLRILIADSGKTHKEVADEIGISPAALSKKLSFEANLTLDSIASIAAATGHTYDVLFRPIEAPRALQKWEQKSVAYSLVTIIKETIHAKREADHDRACAKEMRATAEQLVRNQFQRSKSLSMGWQRETTYRSSASTGVSSAVECERFVANGNY